MAYAAVISLYHTIDRLLNNSSRISVSSSTKQTLEIARFNARLLRITLEKYDEMKNSSQGVMAADARIRDEARRLEDAIESEASAQFLSQSQIHGSYSLNLHHLRHQIDCFVKTAKKMVAEYLEELNKEPSPHDHEEEEEEEEAAAGAADVHIVDVDDDDDMVGLSDHFFRIRDDIVGGQSVGDAKNFLITGMAGIGKTTFVKKLVNDPLVKEKFECRAFVRVGQKKEYEQIVRDILAQVNVDSYKMIKQEKDEHIYDYFRRSLKDRKFLIVLDDVWDKDLTLYTGNCNGSYVLLTSRNVANFILVHDYHYQMRFLNEEESWKLLQRKVFGELQYCPPQLVKAGKKIAENCEGLPLLILTVAKFLSEGPKKPEYWKEVAEMQNSVFEDAMDQIYDLLLPSYHYLAQRSKACFLYMYAFPKNYVVGRSRILNLWRAERFAVSVSAILDDIVSNNLVVIRQRDWRGRKAKAFKLHVVYRHVCKREAENNKFLHILESYAADDDGSTIQPRMKDKPHLAIYHNTLLAIKEVHSSIASVSTLRSVLCTGPYHPYQVPICLELKLLKVLDAVTIRFYEFPIEVVKLIQLRYLSLTTNANLPTSITELWFLRFLIVHQHLSIHRTSTSASVAAESSYVPVEIWKLKQLRHLQIVGRNLPLPPQHASLPDLEQLLDVGLQSCAKEVLGRIPKLEKIRIRIESAPDVAQSMRCFDHISSLLKLKSLVSVIKNPKLLPKPTLPPRLPSISTSHLVKLSLSGFGYPWEDMSKIAELPYLAVLKLQCYAFRGEKWEAKEMRFATLEYLSIEDADLVRWKSSNQTFPILRHLIMRNCHKLQQIPLLKTYEEIELVDCNPSAETCVMQNIKCDVKVDYSWKR